MPAEPRKPRLIPVLDVMGGHVVRAVAGRREGYRAVQSRLTGCVDPITVGASLLAAADAEEIYVADLDAIAGRASVSPGVIEFTEACKRPIWLDVGLGPFKRATVLPQLDHIRPMFGLETCSVIEPIRECQDMQHFRNVGFSLDLRDGELVGDWRAWGLANECDVLGLARRVVEAGVRTLIVIDLARVGTGMGCATERFPRHRADRRRRGADVG
jgi:phosphoribosylformimino-5-aminoimidazole carboxamide ribotide isomerase